MVIVTVMVIVMVIIFVSENCHNEVPQARWLKMAEIYYLSVLEARSLSQVSASHGSS